MQMIFITAVLGVVVFCICFAIKLKADKYFLINAFSKNNVIVYGRKGCGKDLVFNYIINKRKRKCWSNIQFNSKYCTKVPITDLELGDINYERLIDNNVIPVKKKLEEKVDYYLSDGGIYLPSQYTSYLDKRYKSLPIMYALSRHLAEMNVHINTQALGRPWNKLREQADTYIRAVKTIKLPFMLLTKMYAYDKYESAQANLLPFKAGTFSNKHKKALKEQYKATNGLIRTCYILQLKRSVNYDSRAFHEVIYGKLAPTSAPSRKRKCKS